MLYKKHRDKGCGTQNKFYINPIKKCKYMYPINLTFNDKYPILRKSYPFLW